MQLELNITDLMNKGQFLNYVGAMIRSAQGMALAEEDPDLSVKTYAQAHAFQMLFDIVAAGNFDIITPDTRIN